MNKFPTLRNLVASNKVELAMQKFIEWAPANCSGHQDEGVMLAHRYASARGNSHAGVISWQERMEVEKSVVADFLELLQVCEREQNESTPDDQLGASADRDNRKRATVEIVIEGDLSDFPSRRQKLFLLLLSLILNIDFQQISIKKMDKGSIVITLEMPLDSALELQEFFKENAPELRPLLDEFTVLQTPEILTPESAPPQQPLMPDLQKAAAVEKINSMQHFWEIIAENGEENAIRLVFKLYYKKLKSILKNQFGATLPEHNIDDILMNTLERAFFLVSTRKEFPTTDDSFFPFLYKMALHSAQNEIRRTRSQYKKLLDPLLENMDAHSEEENRLDIQQALNQLPENQRQILQLYFEGFSNEEIAQTLGYSSPDAVKAMRHRIINKLKEILKK